MDSNSKAGGRRVRQKSFTITATSSRLAKGLLAIPRKFDSWFPPDTREIQVAFDDEERARGLTFRPYDTSAKESRIFGLGRWFSSRGVREGDLISISVEDRSALLYRVSLDRYLQEQEEQKARRSLHSAPSDPEAYRQLGALAKLTRRRLSEVAQGELLRIAQSSERRPRPETAVAAAGRRASTPPGIRVLLRELYSGKCQICSFTFQMRDGEPYFEVHHLDPNLGHHPTNLLVVCPNCHAQFEHAEITDLKWIGNWLVGVTINGKRFRIRQTLAHDPVRRVGLALLLALAFSQARKGPARNRIWE
ncbi:MAG TPA: HNH endonuclease signature motif containing protein [Terriglobia bacterium]|nr:HNH endonuclease signature motif containing protein [Terriglobia bacterium]